MIRYRARLQDHRRQEHRVLVHHKGQTRAKEKDCCGIISQLRLAEKSVGVFRYIYPDRADNPYFSPLPIFRWKTEFSSILLIGFHIKQTTPYLCPKPYNSIELSELYRIGKLFLHGDMPPCLVGYEWSYLFTSNGE